MEAEEAEDGGGGEWGDLLIIFFVFGIFVIDGIVVWDHWRTMLPSELISFYAFSNPCFDLLKNFTFFSSTWPTISRIFSISTSP